MFKRMEPVTGVVFYCKDCERIVTARQIGRKYVYSCDICKTKNVAFGTEKSIRSFFHYEDAPESAAPVTAKVEAKPDAAKIAAPPTAPAA